MNRKWLVVIGAVSFVLFPISVLHWYFLVQYNLSAALFILFLYTIQTFFSSILYFEFSRKYISPVSAQKTFNALIYIAVLMLVLSLLSLIPRFNLMFDVSGIILAFGISQLIIGFLLMTIKKSKFVGDEVVEAWLITTGFFKITGTLAIVGFILDYLFILYLTLKFVRKN